MTVINLPQSQIDLLRLVLAVGAQNKPRDETPVRPQADAFINMLNEQICAQTAGGLARLPTRPPQTPTPAKKARPSRDERNDDRCSNQDRRNARWA